MSCLRVGAEGSPSPVAGIDFAVKDGRLSSNPAAGVSLPRIKSEEKLYLTHKQVADLAKMCGPIYGVVVRFLAYTGLRWGRWLR